MKRFDQINMIPFIDIMLVLLAIVLTTASFVSQGLIPINLPTAEQASEASNDETPLEIAINAQNEFFLGEEKVTLEQMAEKLKLQAKPETLIVLRIDKATVFEHFVKLIDLLKAQELNNLSIQAQQE
ncbi:MAG: TonB system transport protein ExbD [Candidatus Thiothrix sulfatifontis]|nr:MAG: TonB system transport protein ExbD [Candidatus Thiothrix sulfatifontis]